MDKWQCTRCQYIYDPQVGDLDNDIESGTYFEDLPENWVCPECGAKKHKFEPLQDDDEDEEYDQPDEDN